MASAALKLPDSPVEQIAHIRSGLPAADAKALLSSFDMPIGRLLDALSLPVATFNKKVAAGGALAPSESERVLGLAAMVQQVERMVEESGDPTGFDATAWLSDWLQRHVPALGGAQPLSFLDTMRGQRLVSDLIARMQTGAYS
jgi:putative toxin-antitoxin system antitoxin component (TIGR02293 family)